MRRAAVMQWIEAGLNNIAQWIEAGLNNIATGEGWTIAATGLVIVFIALALIAGFIALMPHFLALFAVVWPEQETPLSDVGGRSVGSEEIENEIAAAIGYAMHARRQAGG